MVLIGAGVGMAPFRGFILNRLKNANCANKIWLIQGVRDSMLDELYSGELGDHEREIKKVVQSRKVKAGGENTEVKYVQDEVRVQADIVWFVINALDGRIFVCGSSKGMGEGVEESLMEVAMQKGGISRAQAQEFWAKKKEDGQYIAVSLDANRPPRPLLTCLRKHGKYSLTYDRLYISSISISVPGPQPRTYLPSLPHRYHIATAFKRERRFT